MNKRVIFLIVFLVVAPFYSFSFIYWYSAELQEIRQEFPIDSYIKHIETSSDIEKLKQQYKQSMLDDNEAQKNISEAIQSLGVMQFLLAISNALFLFFVIKSAMKHASNK